MKTRGDGGAGDDPRRTDQLDDTHRVKSARDGEKSDRDTGARPRAASRSASDATSKLDDQWLQAASALYAARAEFKVAAAAVIDRIKAGDELPKQELDREWNARVRLLEARQAFGRLGHLRKVFCTTEQDGRTFDELGASLIARETSGPTKGAVLAALALSRAGG